MSVTDPNEKPKKAAKDDYDFDEKKTTKVEDDLINFHDFDEHLTVKGVLRGTRKLRVQGKESTCFIVATSAKESVMIGSYSTLASKLLKADGSLKYKDKQVKITRSENKVEGKQYYSFDLLVGSYVAPPRDSEDVPF